MLVDQISKSIRDAMRARDVLRLSVLRMLSSELSYKKIDIQKDLTDEDVVGIILKEAKKRKEAIEAYMTAGRQELVDKEQEELAILQAYLPAQMSEKEIGAELSKMKIPADFGQAMRVVSPMFKGRADGGMVARIVKEILDSRS